MKLLIEDKMWLIYLLALIGLKSVIFGQYWPWQYKNRCPYCKSIKIID